MTHPGTRSIAIALILVSASACGPSARSADNGGVAPGTADRSVTRPTAEEAAEFEAIYRARMDSARTRYTPADVRFVTGMIAHHAQALIMARLAPTNDAGPSLRILAGRVINAQQDEIALMETWLRDRNQPVPEVVVSGIEMSVRGVEMGSSMPGMLSKEQMESLAAARGDEFDRLFLTYMIQHHEGAVTMVHTLFATDGAAQDEAVFRLASDVQVDQITEIDRMKRMLEEMGSGRAPVQMSPPAQPTRGPTP